MLTVPFQQMVSSSSWGAARSQSRQAREPVTLPNLFNTPLALQVWYTARAQGLHTPGTHQRRR